MKKATMSFSSLAVLKGISFIWEAFLEYNISSYLNVWWKDVYSKLRIGLSSHDISLLIIAFKFNWFLCFDRLPNQAGPAGPAGPWPPWLFLKLYFVNYCSLEIRFCIILQEIKKNFEPGTPRILSVALFEMVVSVVSNYIVSIVSMVPFASLLEKF